MNLEEQIEKLTSYFCQGEQLEEQIGVEVEHLVINKEDLTAVDYDAQQGISDILNNFKDEKIIPHKEQDHLLSLSASEFDITIEPGGQFEVGINPQLSIKAIKEIYFNFLDHLLPLLEEREQLLLTLGYQPQSKINDISWLPKKRYEIMAKYLGKQGEYAHNMMKGTAAFQLALDYKSEQDFIRKFRVAMALSPVMSILCDNAPFFEGEVFEKNALRTLIWGHTDDNRTGIIPRVFAADFGYRSYAQYILTREPILLKSQGEYFATGNKIAAEIFKTKDLEEEELEHILTMVFPDVRAKQFIEIRMSDAMPPDYFLAVVAFWKGILYNESNLDQAVQFIEQFSVEDIVTAKQNIVSNGLKAELGEYNILDVADKFLGWAQSALSEDEVDYLKPLQKIVLRELTPAQQLKEQLSSKSKIEVIKEYSLNSLLGVEKDEGSFC
ncbi:MAG: glutamate-cysteine ligase family protein [Bacillota bacterium]